MAARETSQFRISVWLVVLLSIGFVSGANGATVALQAASCAPMERDRLTLRNLVGRDPKASLEMKLPLTVGLSSRR